ncbi:MAG: AAA family ATPase [Candidatus Acidiferrales bacterium]
MFLEYYKLDEQPFGVTPDPRYLYLSATHREALASLYYGVTAGRGFVGLIAKPGMGKTTLLFQLLQRLEASARTVFLFQTLCNPRDFLRSLLADLGVEDGSGDLVRMHSKLNEVLLQASRAEKRFVVVIDEAQNLEDPVLEVVRMLSNFETRREKLMQIVLAGQPQFAERLASPELVQLRQRVSILGRLTPFTSEETNSYIDHRLRVAGYDFETSLFTGRARALIAKHGEGIPRNINNICFNALSLGCALKRKTIDGDIVREVLGDLDLGSLHAEPVMASKSEEEPRRGVSKPDPIVRGQSLISGLLPRFALAGLLLVALSRPVVDGSWSTAKAVTSLVGVQVENASIATPPPTASLIPAAPYPKKVPAATPTVVTPSASASEAKEARTKVHSPESTPDASGSFFFRTISENLGKYRDQILSRILELNAWLNDPEHIQPGGRTPGVPVTGGSADAPKAKQGTEPSDAETEKP